MKSIMSRLVNECIEKKLQVDVSDLGWEVFILRLCSMFFAWLKLLLEFKAWLLLECDQDMASKFRTSRVE